MAEVEGFQQAAIKTTEEKLQAFHDALSADEQDVLATVLAQAAGTAEVSGHLHEVNDKVAQLTVKGSRASYRILLNPAILKGFNPQPDPPGVTKTIQS